MKYFINIVIFCKVRENIFLMYEFIIESLRFRLFILKINIYYIREIILRLIFQLI